MAISLVTPYIYSDDTCTVLLDVLDTAVFLDDDEAANATATLASVVEASGFHVSFEVETLA